MTFAPFNSHTNNIYIDLNLLKVREIIKLHQLKLAYDFNFNQLPEDLMYLFKLASDVHSTNLTLNSAKNKLFFIPMSNTKTFGTQSIRYLCAKLWNSTFKSGGINISPEYKDNVKLDALKSIHHFKNVMKRHYLYEYSLEN